jgi:hypothetical protein
MKTIRRQSIARCGLIFLLGITIAERVPGLTFGERILNLPAGSLGYIYSSFRDAKKVRLTYAGSYSVRTVEKATNEWKSREVPAVLVIDVVKSGDTYSISDSRLFLDGKQADASSVRRHVAMLALNKAKSRAPESVTLSKGTIDNPSNIAQAVNYAGIDQRCSIEIYGNDYFAVKLKTGINVSYAGRGYPCRECYCYKEYGNGSYFWESTYFHDAIPGRIGRFFRKSQNTETQSKREAETEDFDFTLNKMESIP